MLPHTKLQLVHFVRRRDNLQPLRDMYFHKWGLLPNLCHGRSRVSHLWPGGFMPGHWNALWGGQLWDGVWGINSTEILFARHIKLTLMMLVISESLHWKIGLLYFLFLWQWWWPLLAISQLWVSVSIFLPILQELTGRMCNPTKTTQVLLRTTQKFIKKWCSNDFLLPKKFK